MCKVRMRLRKFRFGYLECLDYAMKKCYFGFFRTLYIESKTDSDCQIYADKDLISILPTGFDQIYKLKSCFI